MLHFFSELLSELLLFIITCDYKFLHFFFSELLYCTSFLHFFRLLTALLHILDSNVGFRSACIHARRTAVLLACRSGNSACLYVCLPVVLRVCQLVCLCVSACRCTCRPVGLTGSLSVCTYIPAHKHYPTMSVCPFVCLFACTSICMPLRMSVCTPVCLAECLDVCPCVSARMYVCLCLFMSVCLVVCLPVCPSARLHSVCLPARPCVPSVSALLRG